MFLRRTGMTWTFAYANLRDKQLQILKLGSCCSSTNADLEDEFRSFFSFPLPPVGGDGPQQEKHYGLGQVGILDQGPTYGLGLVLSLLRDLTRMAMDARIRQLEREALFDPEAGARLCSLRLHLRRRIPIVILIRRYDRFSRSRSAGATGSTSILYSYSCSRGRPFSWSATSSKSWIAYRHLWSVRSRSGGR
jgi:hypothetical protein